MRKKKYTSCSKLNCQVYICKVCYNSHDKYVLTYLDHPYDFTVEFKPEEYNQTCDIVVPYCIGDPEDKHTDNDDGEDISENESDKKYLDNDDDSEEYNNFERIDTSDFDNF